MLHLKYLEIKVTPSILSMYKKQRFNFQQLKENSKILIESENKSFTE